MTTAAAPPNCTGSRALGMFARNPLRVAQRTPYPPEAFCAGLSRDYPVGDVTSHRGFF